MAHVPIEWPEGGLNDDKPYSKQPPGTTRDAQNVRTTIPDTGRAGGGQRPGLSKKATNQISSSGKVKDLATVTYDSSNITYAELGAGSETIEWDSTTPAATQCRNIKTDRQSNVYALNGMAGMVKYNSEGEELYKISVPVEDPQHAIIGLEVDELDAIYMGVGSGGDQSTAKAWRYTQGPDENQFFISWEITLGGYVPDIVVQDDQAYIAVNYTDENRSEVQVYNNINTATPGLIKSWSVPHPVNGMDVNTSGEVFTAHPAASDAAGNRPGNPKAPGFSQTAVDWTPRELDDWEARVYRWHDAETITDLDNGDKIFTWDDLSGNGRFLYTDLAVADAPTYNATGIAGKSTVRFESDYSTYWQGLRTLRNPGISVNYRDQQQTFVPAHTDSAFTVYMVVRGVESATDIHTLWYQANDDAASNDHRAILFNRDEQQADGAASTGSTGLISVYDEADSLDQGDGTNGHPLSSDFTSDSTDTVLITYQCDGGVNSGTGTEGTGFTRSVFRVNGAPVDRWTSQKTEAVGASFLGTTGGTFASPGGPATWDGFSGDIAEIIVLQRDDVTDDTQPTVQTEDRLGSDPLGDDGATGTQNENEMTLIEGYLMHKWGISEQADDATYPHPFELPAVPDSNSILFVLYDSRPQTIKWNNSGEAVWGTAGANGLLTVTEGVGIDVAVGEADEGLIFSVGGGIGAGNQVARRLQDLGTTYEASSAAGDSFNWNVSLGAGPDRTDLKIDVDKFDNVYIPGSQDTVASSLLVYAKNSSPSGSGTAVEVGDILLSNSQRGIAVAVDRTVPDYGDDAVDIAEFVYLASANNATPAQKTVHKIKFVSTTQGTGSPRTMVNLAVVDDDIVTFDGTGPTTPTGGAASIDSNSQYIQSVTAFGKVYYTDGQNYSVYDPKEDEVTEYKSASAGKIPPRCKLIELWRGRIVLARDASNPYNWYMSKKDDPTNWDFFPAVRTAVQAVAGNNTEAGERHDIINAIIPINDDLLLFGGDSTIFRLSGDPMAGGELDLLTDKVGIAFGRAYDKDDKGVLYFFGSRGGAYRLQPSGQLERISEYSIDRRLEDVDLSTYYIRVVYNYGDDAVHYFQCPFGAGGTTIAHWVYDTKREAWWEDEFGSTDVQPTAAIVVDGDDPDDRQMLLGCEDGFVRTWDKAALDDDGERIDSYCTMGVFAPYASESEYRFSHFQISLDSTLDACRFDFVPNAEVDVDVAPYMGGELVPGRNPFRMERFRAVFPLLRLRNASVAESWGLEEASIRAFTAGRRRVRG